MDRVSAEIPYGETVIALISNFVDMPSESDATAVTVWAPAVSLSAVYTKVQPE